MCKDPTEAQIREFWKRCGLRCLEPYWIDEDKDIAFYGETKSELIASLDLNNLFKYAVPKLHAWTMGSCPDGDICAVAVIKVGGDYHRGEACSADPALALFWSIWEVIHEKTTG